MCIIREYIMSHLVSIGHSHQPGSPFHTEFQPVHGQGANNPFRIDHFNGDVAQVHAIGKQAGPVGRQAQTICLTRRLHHILTDELTVQVGHYLQYTGFIRHLQPPQAVGIHDLVVGIFPVIQCYLIVKA